MRRTAPTAKILSIRLPASLSAKLSTIARKRKVPVSVVVREVLEQAGERNVGSFGELARDFCGRLSGPPDLSLNADHLKGYGK